MTWLIYNELKEISGRNYEGRNPSQVVLEALVDIQLLSHDIYPQHTEALSGHTV